MLTKSPENNNLLQVRKESKMFTKDLNKTPSLRFYWESQPGQVPFTWESQPGTPKHHNSNTTPVFTPLTPPPSFYFAKTDTSSTPTSKSSKLVHVLFNKMLRNLKKSEDRNQSLSWWSTSSVVPIGSAKKCRRRRRGLSFDYKDGSDEVMMVTCFGTRG